MTTPAGVPNLPQGALTLDNLASTLQDMSGAAMKSRAVERFPSIFNGSTGLDPALDITPFGILTRIWAEVNSLVANSDPEDIQGPDDLPPLLLEFIEGLPVVGQFVDLLEAILGNYAGEDETLLAIQAIFAPIRAVVGALADFQLIRGVIPPWFLPPTHVGRLTNELPPLVSDGGFDQIPTDTSGEAGEWYRDPSIGRSASGAASIEADGERHELIGRPVAVAPGQKYQLGGWFASTAATGTDGCVQIAVTEFGPEDYPLNTEVVVTYTPSGTADFTHQSAEYVVPEGVEMAAATLIVTEGFTAGHTHIDDVTGPSTGLIEMTWVENLIQRWQQIAKLFGIVDTDLDGDVDLEDVWNTLWSVWLKPLNWISTVDQAIIDRIIAAVENLGELGDLDNPVEKVLESIFALVRGGSLTAAEIADVKARVLALESGDSTIRLNFNGSATSSIGSDFDSTFSGAGAGQMGLDGSGNLVWKPSGFLARTQIARYNVSTLSTDNCTIEAFLASTPQSYLFDAAYTYLCWRMNAARTSYMRLRIGYSEIRLQIVVSGTVTNLGSAWSGNPGYGNKIEIVSGDAEPRHFVVKRNGATIIDVEDTSDVSQVGSDYRGVGVGMTTGNRLVVFQNIPAGLSVATFAEVS